MATLPKSRDPCAVKERPPSDDEADLAMRPQRLEVEYSTTLEDLQAVAGRLELVVVLADVGVDVLKTHAEDDEVRPDVDYVVLDLCDADVVHHVAGARLRVLCPGDAAEELLHAGL